MIADQRAQYGIPHAVACRALGVWQSWFCKWRNGDRSPRRARRRALAAMVAYVFHRRRGTYGSPRITAELRAEGWRVSHNTVAALMAEQCLVARRRRRRRSLTRADASARKAPDALQRDFSPPARPDTAWVGDLTEIPTGQGRFHLAAILDLHSRRCVGFAMGERHDAALARAALQVAIAVRGGAVDGVIMHTDQGGEYTGRLFERACRTCGAVQSMGRTGSAPATRSPSRSTPALEFELLSRHRFATRRQARRAVAAWIDDYNTTRRHSAAQMMSPIAYEARMARRQTTAQERTAEAAAPPPSFPGAAHDPGPSLRPQGPLPRSLRDGLRPPLTPETSTAPTGSDRGQAQACPPHHAAHHDKITYREVSTLPGD